MALEIALSGQRYISVAVRGTGFHALYNETSLVSGNVKKTNENQTSMQHGMTLAGSVASKFFFSHPARDGAKAEKTV